MARRVIQAQIGAKGKIRNRPINDDLFNLLSAVGEELDVYIEVGSGGQTSERDPKLKNVAGGWTGSHRHDEGGAADIKVFKVDEDGNKHYLNFTDPTDQKVWSDVVRLTKAGGATGFGAGTGYMGNETVHVGYGKEAVWNPSGPVPDWLTSAVKAGKATPPMPIPDATVPKIVDVTEGGTLPNGAKIPPNAFADRARDGDGKIKGLVFHHTGGTDLSGAMITGQEEGSPQYGFGAQYYIDTDGTIYRYAPDTSKMLNIRSPGKEGRTDAGLPTEDLSNDNVIGVEVVGTGLDEFTPAQMEAAADLSNYLSGEYGIPPSMIVGHGELQGGEGGSKMPDEGVSIAYAAREYVTGNSALGAIDHALHDEAPTPFPSPAFRNASAIDRLNAIRADREEQLTWGGFTRDMGVPLPAPAPLDAPLPDIAPALDNDAGGMVFAPGTGELADIMRERYGPTYDTGTDGGASIYEQLGLPKPTAATPVKKPTTMVGNPDGLVEGGNIDLDARKPVINPDGSVSTEQSISVNIDGVEVLIPTVYDGKHHSEEDAIKHYRDTGEHLGKFSDPEAATKYADDLHNRQDEIYNPTDPAIGQPPGKRVVKTIKVRLDDMSRNVDEGVAPPPDVPPPAPGVRVSDTGTMRLGRPIVMVEDDDAVIEPAPAPAAVPREAVQPVLPPSLRGGALLNETTLVWTPPKTLADALAGTSYASASNLSKAGFVLDSDPHIAPKPVRVTEAETRTEQNQMRARPPSQSVITPPAPGEVMKPDDYTKLVERGTEVSPPNPEWEMPRKVGWNENWIDRGKNQGRLVTAPATKVAPTPAPEPRFRRVVETVRNPKYDEWAAKYAKATEGDKAWTADDANDYSRYSAPGGVDTYDERSTIPKPTPPIVPPAPDRTITVERNVPIPPPPRPRPATPSAPATGGNYVIQSGDTLSEIALRNGVSLSDLQRANGITDPNRIYAGNQIIIPGRTSSGTPAPTPSRNTGAPKPTPSTSGGTPVYINRQGQTVKPEVKKFYDADSNTWVERTVFVPA